MAGSNISSQLVSPIERASPSTTPPILYFDSKLFITFVIFVILIFILELNLCTDGETAGLRSRIYIAFHLLALTGYRQETAAIDIYLQALHQTVVSEEC